MKIPLKLIESRNKHGEVEKSANGDVLYEQNDAQALMTLLQFIDTRKMAGMSEYKIYLGIYDKILFAWRNDLTDIDFTAEEVVFLRDFLLNIYDKTRPEIGSIGAFLLRTVVSVGEELEKL